MEFISFWDVTLLIPALVFVMAFLYASVGHGGASGYLAVLSFFSFSQAEMASTALALNILVAGLAFWAYARAGYFRWHLTWPFLITSIPMAYVGGALNVSASVYSLLLAVALLVAAGRLFWQTRQHSQAVVVSGHAPIAVSLPIGGVVGLISGIVGVGGGIFLSPILLLMKWADMKKTAAASALFIVLNAAAGLLGRASRDGLVFLELWPLLLAGALGGWLGSRLGAQYWRSEFTQKILALVLLIAAFKLFLKALPSGI